jgi:hypothetical protein
MTVTDTVTLPEGMVDAINTALLAGRGTDVRVSIVRAVTGDAPLLDESVAAAGVAVDHLAGRITDSDLETAIAFALDAVRGEDCSLSERHAATQISSWVIRAWVASTHRHY